MGEKFRNATQCNLIAKCQWNCTNNVLQHQTDTLLTHPSQSLIKQQIKSQLQQQTWGGEKLLINKYMRKCQLIQLQVGFNTTLSPSVSVIAQRMFSNAKYTCITHSRQSLIKQQIKSQQQQTWESKVIGKYIHKKKSVSCYNCLQYNFIAKCQCFVVLNSHVSHIHIRHW